MLSSNYFCKFLKHLRAQSRENMQHVRVTSQIRSGEKVFSIVKDCRKDGMMFNRKAFLGLYLRCELIYR